MGLSKIRSTLIPIVTVCLILAVAGVIIAYGRGYRLDFQKKSVKSTGLLVVSSEPSGGQILVNDIVKSATPTTLTLSPGWYNIAVAKEGFQTWEKKLRVQGEVVSKAEALLIPANPSLSAITSGGAIIPVLSPDGSKLAYLVPPAKTTGNGTTLFKPGIWILDLIDKPLGLNRDARQITNLSLTNYNKVQLSWSPDSKQVLMCLGATPPVGGSNCQVYDADKFNDSPKPVSSLSTLETDWKEQIKLHEKEKLVSFPQEFVALATASARLLTFAPDETKVMYEATAAATLSQALNLPPIGSNSTAETREIKPGYFYIYDVKEDRNYNLGETKTLPLLSWLPTSKHLLIIQKDKIDIMDFDGANRRTLYAGPFGAGFAAPWTNNSKIIILTNLNPGTSAVNNLYAVNLK